MTAEPKLDAPAAVNDALLHGLAAGLMAMVHTPEGGPATLRQLGVLLLICTTPGPHTVRGLAAQLRVPKPTISRVLDALSKAGLARRTPDPTDCRSVRVVPTPQGRMLIRGIAAAAREECVARGART